MTLFKDHVKTLMGEATRLLNKDITGYEDLKRKRKGGESLKELGQSIKGLVELAYPELQSSAKDRLASEHF